MNVNTFGQRLRDGEVEVQEIIENLRRFPQTAKVRVRRDMVSVKIDDTLHWLNEEYTAWPFPED